MSPLRWEVLAVALVLALPVMALGVRGDLAPQDVVVRLPWCLVAAWAAVAVLRWALTPPRAQGRADTTVAGPEPADPA